ncbi:hypothetical protein F5Y11DRAFT_347385 [Daldinia sp. FL1419]|nr:hypothetical protein F5Y11DRAFT_347385 [Daldinia sp. FL1419]
MADYYEELRRRRQMAERFGDVMTYSDTYREEQVFAIKRFALEMEELSKAINELDKDRFSTAMAKMNCDRLDKICRTSMSLRATIDYNRREIERYEGIELRPPHPPRTFPGYMQYVLALLWLIIVTLFYLDLIHFH